MFSLCSFSLSFFLFSFSSASLALSHLYSLSFSFSLLLLLYPGAHWFLCFSSASSRRHTRMAQNDRVLVWIFDDFVHMCPKVVAFVRDTARLVIHLKSRKAKSHAKSIRADKLTSSLAIISFDSNSKVPLFCMDNIVTVENVDKSYVESLITNVNLVCSTICLSFHLVTCHD